MVSKEEFKKLVIALGKKWLFPDFTNKLTWLVVSVGCGIVIAPMPLKLLFYNWLVNTINLNSWVPFTLSEIQSDSTEYIWGVILVTLALVHNIGNRYFLYLTSLISHREAENKEIADKNLFNQFLDEFPSNSASLRLLKEHDFGNSFYGNKTEQTESFVNNWNNAEKQFLDSELEEKRQELWQHCNSFLLKLAESSGPIGVGPMFTVIPDTHLGKEFDMPAFVTERISNLNDKATACYKLHQELVTLCKQKLKC